MKTLDIRSNHPGTRLLSNFYPHEFTLDKIAYASMEAFLQCLKFPYPDYLDEWAKCSALSGIQAKNFGRKSPDWRPAQVLYYGKSQIQRSSMDYQHLLDRAFHELYQQNCDFRAALFETKSCVLVHTIGKRDKSQTVLTEREFVERLTRLREYGER